MHTSRMIAAGVTVAALLSTVALLPAGAVPAGATSSWRMNEGTAATVMHDSGSNGLEGTIGSRVRTGVVFGGGVVGYRWPFTRPNAPPAKPERLVVVADDDRLDPWNRTYTVTIRYRTRQPFGNIVQKGQAAAEGGYWKIQAPRGVVACLFKGSAGRATASSVDKLNDGRWHTVRCERSRTRVVMTVDGKVTSVRNAPTGTIANRNPLTIGGKLNCNQVKVTCDYFSGAIDYVRVESG